MENNSAPRLCARPRARWRYRDNYPDATLQAWARHIKAWRRQRREVFVYFDNDQKSAAPVDARRLLDLVSSHRASGNKRAA
jgi:uncharacterized protein YecE (DUF72 family)